MDQVELVDFTWLHDMSDSDVQYWTNKYGLSDPAFGAILSSLGFRSWAGNGTDKPAFKTLLSEAQKRGW